MTQPKVTFQIVTWNSRRHIGDCLKSIYAQTDRDFQVLIIDNASKDDTLDYIRKYFPMVTIFQNNKNLGFARAHNQGFELISSPYVVICNPDIMLTEHWLETMMARVERAEWQKVGSFGGTLLRLNVSGDEYSEKEPTNIIDSLGLALGRDHQSREIGSDQEYQGPAADRLVFGHSGALVLYRRDALKSVALVNRHGRREYFDEDFFSYKEDVDLSWRLQLAGWPALHIGEAEAYHVRAMRAASQTGMLARYRHRRGQSYLCRYYSYRNQFLLLAKDQYLGLLFSFSPAIIWRELKKLIYVLILEWSSVRALFDVIKLLPAMMRKRRIILGQAKVSAREMTQWFSN